jgi:hypothetical protein
MRQHLSVTAAVVAVLVMGLSACEAEDPAIERTYLSVTSEPLVEGLVVDLVRVRALDGPGASATSILVSERNLDAGEDPSAGAIAFDITGWIAKRGGTEATLEVTGLQDGKVIARFEGVISISEPGVVKVKMRGLDLGCDADGDGFVDCSIADCCDQSESPFTDCEGEADDAGPGMGEVCDGLDNDCDGETDEGVLNACGTCGEVPTEVCDGDDNDCDGEIDEGVLNACGTCGEAPTEVCDGLDNDCDGETDEGVLNACGSCGEVPEEICDSVDNDCDGIMDEGFNWAGLAVGDDCKGFGSCGDMIGAVVCDLASGTPTCSTMLETHPDSLVGIETCDGLDEDCDELVDEDFTKALGMVEGGLDEACGIGGCAGGAYECDDSGAGTRCDSMPGGSAAADTAETCDGADNDCDGAADEDFDADGSAVGEACVHAACGDGTAVCETSGLGAVCDSTQTQPDTDVDGISDCADDDDDGDGTFDGDDCEPLDASIHPEAVEVCNGIDDDCNDEIDETGASGEACGEGACSDGKIICWKGAPMCSSTVETHVDYAISDEVCNGADDDCDGNTDEAVPVQACGVGACAEGETYCEGGDVKCTFMPGGDFDKSLAEACDGLDNDCDGATDNGFFLDDPEVPGGLALGAACDGVDTDLCPDGLVVCAPSGEIAICDDSVNDAEHAELCNGLDDDCDDQTADGAAEVTLGYDCDGSDDVDLCEDGTTVCADGDLECEDDSANADDYVESCNGLDDDCDPDTLDGAAEPTLGDLCDSEGDVDLCADGAIVCSAAELACDDDDTNAEAYLELCNGDDDDCNADTADGADEPTLGAACDSADDVDLCEDGVTVCSGAVMGCSDDDANAADYVEICNGEDDDCDANTADGSADPSLGADCDGEQDSDVCEEGTWFCSAEGALTCSDDTDSTVETCDGVDEDCDLAIDEDFHWNEILVGDACDGADEDLCLDGVVVCTPYAVGGTRCKESDVPPRLVTAVYHNGLWVLNVEDPDSIQYVYGLAAADLGSSYHYMVTVDGDIAYTTDTTYDGPGLMAVDISDPLQIEVVGTYNVDPGFTFMRTVTIEGDLAYAGYNECKVPWSLSCPPESSGAGGIRILNVSDPSDIQPVSSYEYSSAVVGGHPYKIQIVEDVAYVADRSFGLFLINVGDPQAMSYMDSFDGWPSDGCADLHPLPDNAADYTACVDQGGAYDLEVIDDVAYVALGIYGVMIIDVTNPYDVQFHEWFYVGSGTDEDPYGAAWGIEVADGLLYVAAGSRGVMIYDVSDPANPTEVGNYATSVTGYTYDVELEGRTLFMGDYAGFISALDVEDPSQPTLRSTYLHEFLFSRDIEVYFPADDAIEVCDGEDNDCDGIIDEGVFVDGAPCP